MGVNKKRWEAKKRVRKSKKSLEKNCSKFKKNHKNFIFFLISHNIFFDGFFDFLIKIWIFDKKIIFLPQLFFKVGKVEDFPKELEKWKIFRFIGNFSTTANIPIIQFWKKLADFFPNWKIFHLLQMFQFIWFYWKNFHLLQSVWKLAHFRARINKISQFSKKLEKWKIFQFTGKFSSTANSQIHQILD